MPSLMLQCNLCGKPIAVNHLHFRASPRYPRHHEVLREMFDSGDLGVVSSYKHDLRSTDWVDRRTTKGRTLARSSAPTDLSSD